LQLIVALLHTVEGRNQMLIDCKMLESLRDSCRGTDDEAAAIRRALARFAAIETALVQR
jgi:hypothetical protein